jgi:hypothetical protein
LEIFMNDLLKEAIADAKAVKEVALANAKLALEEAFTPRLQSMLSKKLAEEAEAEEPVEEGEGEEEAPVEEYGFYSEGEDEEPAMEEGEGEEEEPVEEGEDEEAPVEEAEEEEPSMEEGEDEEEPMDEELMEIIRQLEEDIDSSEIGGGDNKKPSAVASDDSTEDKKEKLVQLVEEEDEDSEEVAEIKEILRALREEEGEEEKVEEGEDEEEVDIKEVLRALREEEGEEEKVEEAEEDEEKEMAEAKLREAYAVITFLRSKINEVNLLNSKLLFSNKLFRKHSLSEKQKMTVIENFDRASSLREVKLIFATLSESFRTTKVKPIRESFASKPTASTRPSKPILNEGDDMASRLRKLAGLK